MLNVKTKQVLQASALIAASLIGATAHAELSDLTMRVRAIYIDPADKSDAIPALGVPKDSIDVQSKWAPDIDFEYAISPHWGAELLLTVPQRHDVVAKQTVLGNNVKLGSVQHLPPTLTAKYYFLTDKVRPYVGAGVNFTWFTDDDLSVPTVGKLTIKRTSIGPALQAGVDVSLNTHWSLSFDAKKAYISTDVKLNGAKVTTVDVDPLIYGAGVGYKF